MRCVRVHILFIVCVVVLLKHALSLFAFYQNELPVRFDDLGSKAHSQVLHMYLGLPCAALVYYWAGEWHLNPILFNGILNFN